jgi:hypothetical protein
MGFESLTDNEIDRLIRAPKRAINAPQAKVKRRANAQHEELVIKLVSDEGEFFTFYTRQNLKLSRDFSCGLTWQGPSGEVHLLRLNGSGHDHPPLGVAFHIHKATERAIRDGRKPEAYAEVTTAYDSMDGAKHQLVAMAHITGISAPAPHPQLLP